MPPETKNWNSSEYDNNSVESVYEEEPDRDCQQRVHWPTDKGTSETDDRPIGSRLLANRISTSQILDELFPLLSALCRIAEECETQLKQIRRSGNIQQKTARYQRTAGTYDTLPKSFPPAPHCNNNTGSRPSNQFDQIARVTRPSSTAQTLRRRPDRNLNEFIDSNADRYDDTRTDRLERFSNTGAVVDRSRTRTIDASTRYRNKDSLLTPHPPIPVSASLVITYPVVDRVTSHANQHRRMVCSATHGHAPRPPLRRTVSDEYKKRRPQTAMRDFAGDWQHHGPPPSPLQRDVRPI